MTQEKAKVQYSNDLSWQLQKEGEIFCWNELFWDIDGAKRILQTIPHIVIEMDINTVLTNWKDTEKLIDPDNLEQADFLFPTIVGWEDGKLLIIDGWHRVYKALKHGVNRIPVVVLTPEESANLKHTLESVYWTDTYGDEDEDENELAALD